MGLSHRPVAEKDIPLICGFPRDEEELFHLFPRASYPLTPRQLLRAIEHRADSTVVERDGEVAGFANFHRWERHGCCSIGNVIVSPAARRSGVGRYLIETMIGLAVSRHGASEVNVSCFNTNAAGLLLYTQLGFRPFGVEERLDRRGNRVALVHMRLDWTAARVRQTDNNSPLPGI
ncbi:MAG: GNAT family N-acetyltransferase [Desulfobulbaceae bacterium]|jgi:ribosomal protein S18 acetylase RimI-like enzyme|nr:GNAT family N-acetyltransferase [Desulfobulbaceae bacterium]MDY0350439.1 GNAT family N-acetyltransferase [Desulfobulbaceae bacterium]